MTARQAFLGSAAALLGASALWVAAPAMAEMRPSLAFSGVTGLIDMPSGDAQNDGALSITKSWFGPIGRTTLSFQITPRLSGSFRYASTGNYNVVVPSPLATLYDRNFDLRYQLVKEGQYLPAITVGLQDVIGNGRMAGEYVAATKTFGDRVKVTAGLGWGRYGSYGSFGAPFGPRPVVDFGLGGTPRLGQWFKGNVAPFAGIEWQVTNGIGFKAEYSSDIYAVEAGSYQTFDRKSPFNFGVEYQANDRLRLGLYSLYGTEIGISAQIVLDPKRSPFGGQTGPGPIPVVNRTGAKGWSTDWVTDAGSTPALRDKVQKVLAADGIVIESIALSADRVQLRIRNTRLDNAPQAIGRSARALAALLPPSVEIFEIVPVVEGMTLAKVVVRRSDLENLEFAPGQDSAMRRRAGIVAVSGAQPDGALMGKGLYPKFTWNLAPYLRSSLFDPVNPLRVDFGARVGARYDIAPGLVLSGSVTKKLVGHVDNKGCPSITVDIQLTLTTPEGATGR